MIKLKNHCVISFGFRKGKTEHFSFQFRAISSFFLINLLNTRDRTKPYLLLYWTVVGGRVDYQAWQEFFCVWLELVCHKCLVQSGIWTSLNGEL